MEDFEKLPKNILKLLFDYLKVSDAFNLELTCKGFKKLVYEKEMFKNYYLQIMKSEPVTSKKETIDWKKLYVQAIRESSEIIKKKKL